MAKQAVSVEQIMRTNFKTFPLTGPLSELLGTPEQTGHWFVYGESGHGKTTLLMQMAKVLSEYKKVEYNTLEEGARLSMKLALAENKMHECKKGRFSVLDKMPMEELELRLSKPRSAKVVIVDSLQYTFIDKKQFAEIDRRFGSTHLFIWNSHASGKNPVGALAEAIMFHADQKIYVSNFTAYSKSRTNRGKSSAYAIWPEGSQQLKSVL